MLPHSFSIEIDSLRVWRINRWIKYNTNISNAVIKVYYDQLIILNENKVLESISLGCKIKGINKQDYLILFISTSSNQIRKIKFQIKNNIKQSLKGLGSKFPIIEYNTSNYVSTSTFQDVNDALQQALERKENLIALPNAPSVTNFVKLCLLDPQFPQIVLQIQEVLDGVMNKK